MLVVVVGGFFFAVPFAMEIVYIVILQQSTRPRIFIIAITNENFRTCSSIWIQSCGIMTIYNINNLHDSDGVPDEIYGLSREICTVGMYTSAISA